MSHIVKLAPDVASKIAAGEVIERPVNVVKELVENALDASANLVSIELSDGGKSLVRIEDNGTGIPYNELPAAVQNFSTSKISSVDDIMNVHTLGFRGEALASIRAVSRMTIRSYSNGDDVGREMQWHGERLVKDSPHVRNPGTEVRVADLFYNLPARRKFLAGGRSELRRIMSLIQSFALSFVETAFTLKEDGRDIISYTPSTLKEKAEAVFGSSVFPHLRSFKNRSYRLSVYGLVSLPDMTRGNRSLQFFFINRRHVKDSLLVHAVHQAYHSLIPSGRFPFVVLFLEIPPDEVDVNVHPTKAQIRFKNEREIHRFVSSTLREALKGEARSFQDRVESVYRSIFPRHTPSGAIAGDEATASPEGRTGVETAREGAEVISPGWVLHEAPVSLFSDDQKNKVVPAGNLYWQLHQSYILIQIRGGMVIVDQHAAHERILFNKAKKNLASGKPAVQSLLFPATLELSPEEFERYEQLSQSLPSLGFEVEPFGLRSVIVQGIPAGVRNWNDGRLLRDILCEKGMSHTSIEEFLKTYACKSAIKAGTKLSVEEMESLTDQLFATEFPFTCPHGRPTMLRIGLAELERRFQRTVSPEK